MIDVADLRIFVCTTPTNIQDPTSGHLFLFLNRRRDRIKILLWDQDGFWIFYKRLEEGTFQILTTTNDEEGMEIEYSQLVRLLGGLDLKTGRRRQRYLRTG
jgi:transposase